VGVDLSTFIRLYSAIEGVIDAVPEGMAAVSGNALPKAYNEPRVQVESAIPDELLDEFNQFPARYGSRRSGPDIRAGAERHHQARGATKQLAGSRAS
jgi:hypothetical protein